MVAKRGRTGPGTNGPTARVWPRGGVFGGAGRYVYGRTRAGHHGPDLRPRILWRGIIIISAIMAGGSPSENSASFSRYAHIEKGYCIPIIFISIIIIILLCAYPLKLRRFPARVPAGIMGEIIMMGRGSSLKCAHNRTIMYACGQFRPRNNPWEG